MEALAALFTELGLDSVHLKAFQERLKTKHYYKKEHLIEQGAVCSFIGFVVSGTLRSYIKNAEQEFNNDFYFDGYFLSAYSSFLTRQPTNCNIEALSDCTVLMISYDSLEALVASDSAFLRLTKYISDTNFVRKCKRESSFLKDTASGRLEGLSVLYPGIGQRVSQYHIASYLGVKPESLSRIKLLTYINK